MNCYDAVSQATNQREALLALAKALDARFDALEAAKPAVDDGWGEPLIQYKGQNNDAAPHYGGSPPLSGDRVVEILRSPAGQVAGLKDELNYTTDPEERAVLEARIRLLTDGLPVDNAIPAGRAVEITGESNNYPVADKVRRQSRGVLWNTSGLATWLTEPIDDPRAAYEVGGPMWLYDFDADGMRSMPPAVLRDMIDNDVALDSPRRAQEMGRDLLKASGEEGKERAYVVAEEANDD